MNYRSMAQGLGVFSLALGAAELLGGRRIARTLDAPGHSGLVRGFGLREIGSGAALLAAPGAPALVWNRVAGDALDLAALGLAARKAPRNRAVWGSLAFVIGVMAVDMLVARGLQRRAGGGHHAGRATPVPRRASPDDQRENTRGATSIEPEHLAQGTAPQIG